MDSGCFSSLLLYPLFGKESIEKNAKYSYNPVKMTGGDFKGKDVSAGREFFSG